MNRTYLKEAIENDFDSFNEINVPSVARLPGKWQIVMLAILNLPMSPWNDPGAVSGEIDTERKR